MFGSIFSGFGFWDAGAWLLLFVFAAALTLAVRAMGRRDYKKGTPQADVYYSGNPSGDDIIDVASVPASSAYWGFREALKGYYKVMNAMHSGDGLEYAGWFVVTAAVLLVLAVV